MNLIDKKCFDAIKLLKIAYFCYLLKILCAFSIINTTFFNITLKFNKTLIICYKRKIDERSSIHSEAKKHF